MKIDKETKTVKTIKDGILISEPEDWYYSPRFQACRCFDGRCLPTVLNYFDFTVANPEDIDDINVEEASDNYFNKQDIERIRERKNKLFWYVKLDFASNTGWIYCGDYGFTNDQSGRRAFLDFIEKKLCSYSSKEYINKSNGCAGIIGHVYGEEIFMMNSQEGSVWYNKEILNTVNWIFDIDDLDFSIMTISEIHQTIKERLFEKFKQYVCELSPKFRALYSKEEN